MEPDVTAGVASGRLAVWRALSELYLDTELDARNFDAIARSLAATGFATIEIRDILWREVHPVLSANLRSVAGVWDGWPDDWLLARLRATSGPYRIRGERAIVDEVRRCWDEVARRLAASIPVRTPSA